MEERDSDHFFYDSFISKNYDLFVSDLSNFAVDFNPNFNKFWEFYYYCSESFHFKGWTIPDNEYILEGKSTKFYQKRALTSTFVEANLDKRPL